MPVMLFLFNVSNPPVSSAQNDTLKLATDSAVNTPLAQDSTEERVVQQCTNKMFS